jgi:hypothetical protein
MMTTTYRFDADGSIIRLDVPAGIVGPSNPATMTQTQPTDPHYQTEYDAAIAAGATPPA